MTEPIKWRDARKVKPRLREFVLAKPRMMLPFEAQYVGCGFWARATDRATFMTGKTCGGNDITHWAPMPKGPKR